MAPGCWASPAFPLKRTPQAEATSSRIPHSQVPPNSEAGQPPAPQEPSVPQTQQQPLASTQHERERRPNSHGTSNSFGDPYDGDLEGDGELGDDPRIRAHAPPKRTAKSHEQKLVHSMIRCFLVHKKLIDDASESDDNAVNPRNQIPPSLPSLPPSPDPMAVKDYLSFHNTGPSSELPLLLWAEPMSHPWNERLVQLLSSEFIDYAKDKQLIKLVQLLGDDIRTPTLISKRLEGVADISKLIHDKLSGHRSQCLAVLRKVERMKAQAMTTNEILADLNTLKRGRKDHLRRSERRKLLYCRRYEIVEESLLKPTIFADPDSARLWEHIRQFFSTFVHEDMSSDETETEKTYLTPKTTRRVRRYWIHDDVTQVFHFVDSHYTPFTTSGSIKRGSPPLIRLLESKKVNTKCTPRPKLAKNIYSDDISMETLEFLLPQPTIRIPKVPKVSMATASHPTIDNTTMDTN